jgi:hypothetical protein
VIPVQIRHPVRPGSPVDAQLCPGKRLALEHGMAIMWDPPAERPSLEPTPAEVAWKQWLMEAIVARTGETPTEPPTEPTEEIKPAA